MHDEEIIDKVQVILSLPDDEFYEYIGEMVEFYRNDPISAVYDILGLKLTEYQKVIIKSAWFSLNIYLCQSRGSGKSFLMAIIACLWAILYPNETILMLGPSYRQSLMLYDKIMTDVYNKSFSLRYELPISKMKKGTMDASMTFNSKSKIKFLPIGDGNKIRGERATFVMLDEHAQHDKTMIDRVIMPMLAADLNYDPDNPNDDYQAKMLAATSAYFQFNHSYRTFQTHLHKMNTDLSYYCAVVPYQIPLDAKVNGQNFIDKQRQEMSNDDFEMEMNCKWISGNDSSFISMQTWDKYIKYEDSLEPMKIGNPKKEYVLFADIAREEGGDNASLKVAEIRGHKLAIVKQISLNGYAYQEIRNEIRKILVHFNIIDLWMDKLGGGRMVADLLDEDWMDFDTGTSYPPILEKDSGRRDGIKLITFVVADNKLNHEMGHLAKKHVEKGHFVFPQLMDRHPDKELEELYVNLIAVKREVTNIQATPAGNYHKFVITKGSGMKKDRWTTFCYASLYLEKELNQTEEDEFYFAIF